MTPATLDVQSQDAQTALPLGGPRVRKRVLRVGDFPATPTPSGRLARPLTIRLGGRSSFEERSTTIALEDLVSTFPGRHVPLVLSSDADDDHAAPAASFVGKVDALEIEHDGPECFLTAVLTVPDASIRWRILTGVLPDVSARVDFGPDAAFLDHVCLTRRPFIDRLGGFAVAASDQRLTGRMVCFALSAGAPRTADDPHAALRAAQHERMAVPARPARPVYARPLADRVADMKSALGGDDGGDLEQRIADMKASLGRE